MVRNSRRNLRMSGDAKSGCLSVGNRYYYRKATKEERKQEIYNYLNEKGPKMAKEICEELRLPSLKYTQILLREMELEGRIHSYGKRPKKYFVKVPWGDVGSEILEDIIVAWENCDGFQVHRLIFSLPLEFVEPLFGLKEGLGLDNLLLRYERGGIGNLWVKATRTSKLRDAEGREILIQISRRGCVQVMFKKGSKPFPRSSKGVNMLEVMLNRSRDVLIDLLRAARAVSSPQVADEVVPLVKDWILTGFDLLKDGKLIRKLEHPLVYERFGELLNRPIVYRVYKRSRTNIIRSEVSYQEANIPFEGFKNLIKLQEDIQKTQETLRETLTKCQERAQKAIQDIIKPFKIFSNSNKDIEKEEEKFWEREQENGE